MKTSTETRVPFVDCGLTVPVSYHEDPNMFMVAQSTLLNFGCFQCLQTSTDGTRVRVRIGKWNPSHIPRAEALQCRCPCRLILSPWLGAVDSRFVKISKKDANRGICACSDLHVCNLVGNMLLPPPPKKKREKRNKKQET